MQSLPYSPRRLQQQSLDLGEGYLKHAVSSTLTSGHIVAQNHTEFMSYDSAQLCKTHDILFVTA